MLVPWKVPINWCRISEPSTVWTFCEARNLYKDATFLLRLTHRVFARSRPPCFSRCEQLLLSCDTGGRIRPHVVTLPGTARTCQEAIWKGHDIVFHPSIFRCDLLVSGRVSVYLSITICTQSIWDLPCKCIVSLHQNAKQPSMQHGSLHS